MPNHVEIEGLDEALSNLRKLKLSTEKRVLGKAAKAGITILARETKKRAKGSIKEAVGITTMVKDEQATSYCGFGRDGWWINFVEYGHRIVGHRIRTNRINRKTGNFIKLAGKDTGKRVPAYPFIRPAFDTKYKAAIQAVSDTLTEQIEKANIRAQKKATRLLARGK